MLFIFIFTFNFAINNFHLYMPLFFTVPLL